MKPWACPTGWRNASPAGSNGEDYLPERPDAFPMGRIQEEGQTLAFELARFAGDEYQVEYDGHQVIVFP